MGEIPVRAITVGVSIFLVIITISVILLYVNTAQDVATEFNDTRKNVSAEYNKILEENITSDMITGQDFINFIRANSSNSNIVVYIETINGESINKYKSNNALKNVAEGYISLIKPTYVVEIKKYGTESKYKIIANIYDPVITYE